MADDRARGERWQLPPQRHHRMPRRPGFPNRRGDRRRSCWATVGSRASSPTSGGGGLRWQGLAITRYQPDVVGDGDGVWIYLRDEESGRLWLATSNEARTTFAVHKAEFHRRNEGISVHVDVTVAPADDVEVRQITLHNETDRTRRLAVTSAGEPVLLPAAQATTHPAFVGCSSRASTSADLDALLFARRPQAPDDDTAVLVHRLVTEGSAVTFAGYETDRAAFFGRGAYRARPEVAGSPRARRFAVASGPCSIPS